MKKAKPSNFLILLFRAFLALFTVVILGALFYHFLIPNLEENDEFFGESQEELLNQVL
jgi:hypothetical protein